MTQYYPPNTKMFDNRPIHRRDPLLLDVVGRLQKEGVYEDNLRTTNFVSEKPRNGLGLTEPLGAAPGPIANVIPMPEQEPAYDTTIERPDVPPPYNPNYPVTTGPRPTTQVHPGIVASVSDTTANVTLIEDGSVVTASLLLPNEKVSSDCLPALAEDDSVSVLETPDGYWYVLQGFIEKADIYSAIVNYLNSNMTNIYEAIVALGTPVKIVGDFETGKAVDIDGSDFRAHEADVVVLSKSEGAAKTNTLTLQTATAIGDFETGDAIDIDGDTSFRVHETTLTVFSKSTEGKTATLTLVRPRAIANFTTAVGLDEDSDFIRAHESLITVFAATEGALTAQTDLATTDC